ncbi:alpha-amylase family glycosyl hydrolase [Arthrobacter sp. AL12]|uniref:alpha-amylase family glycosyl hydrolase n=1 Tax=Arthrobacter sp. AL12 TaxID=3042241 RepID=UPI00249B4038|nr:alpha-amylase family glycosyl hydrolase [Arthrobacter sp. AL12]MDI3212763.1 alpha-amylase family glycosyl hydrolase [Arthrobacter sp. AL12]
MPGPNRTGAEDFLATHLDLAAPFSWDVRQQNMNALNSHDTARAATVMIDGGQRLGAVLMFTLPGVPVVHAGDEFGLKGNNGEASRTPMPWNDPDRVLADLREDYAALAALRREQSALTGGGIRWLHAEGDALSFVREAAGSSVLVVVIRAAADVHLAPGSLNVAQRVALDGDSAFSTGHISAHINPGHLDTGQSSADPLAGGQIRAGGRAGGQIRAGGRAGGQIRADGTAPGALICTRGAAAAVWVLPGTPLPRAAPRLTPVSAPPSGAPGSAP